MWIKFPSIFINSFTAGKRGGAKLHGVRNDISGISRFPHRLKSKSTIKPIIDECLSRWNHVTNREEDKASQQPLRQREVCACVRLFVTKGEVDAWGRAWGKRRRGRLLKRESDIHRIEREREKDIERRHRGFAVSSRSRRAWKRIAALPFAFLRVSHSVASGSRFRARSPCTFPSAVHLVQRFRQLITANARPLRQRVKDIEGQRRDFLASCRFENVSDTSLSTRIMYEKI